MLEALLSSTKIIGMATSKLKGMFEEKGLSAIVLTLDDKATDGPLPGFKMDMYDTGVVILREASYNLLHAEMEARPHMLTNAEFEEFTSLKQWQASLKTESNVNGELQARATDQFSDNFTRAERARTNTSGIDPAY